MIAKEIELNILAKKKAFCKKQMDLSKTKAEFYYWQEELMSVLNREGQLNGY